MEAPLRHINCRHLTLESAGKLTNMSDRIQDTTYYAIFFIRRFKGQILPSVSVILIQKDASTEPPCCSHTTGSSYTDLLSLCVDIRYLESCRTMEAPLRHIHGRIFPLHRLIKCERQCQFIFIQIFDKKILLHIFFKVSLKLKHKIKLLKHKILASYVTLSLKTYKINSVHKNGARIFFQSKASF